VRLALALSALSGFIAVAVGAWSAHDGGRLLDAQGAAWVHTGVEYQAWHTLALFGTAVLMAVRPARLLVPVAIAFGLGILLFSGSLYALALTGIRSFALATPVGGTAMLAGWLLLALYALALGRGR
jgi:uncharacterized membrane protein YgdD (TMEM256/DUF423 family)